MSGLEDDEDAHETGVADPPTTVRSPTGNGESSAEVVEAEAIEEVSVVEDFVSAPVVVKVAPPKVMVVPPVPPRAPPPLPGAARVPPPVPPIPGRPPVVPPVPAAAKIPAPPPRPMVPVPPIKHPPPTPPATTPAASRPAIPVPPPAARPKVPTAPPPTPPPPPADHAVSAVSIDAMDDAVESEQPRPPEDDLERVEAVVADDIALETQLETPTVIEQAVAGLGDASFEQRAEQLARDAERLAGSERSVVAGLHYELGELYERRLADEARAVKAFGKALNTDPTLRPNLWAIRRIFYRRGLWPNLIKLLDAELRFAKTDPDRADLLMEKGLLLRDRMEQLGEAKVAFEEAARLQPELLPPLIALERLALADGDLASAAVVWDRLALASRMPERKLVHLLDLARHHAAAGGDASKARGYLVEASLLGVDAVRVAEERVRIAEAGDDPDELIVALEALLAAQPLPMMDAADPALRPRAPGSPLDRGVAVRLRAAAIRRRQAQVARAARQGDRAWDFLQQALTVAPGEPLLLADLADLAEELGRFDELAELVQSWQSLEGDPSRAVTLSIRRVDALLRGGQAEAAGQLLASIEGATPGLLPLTALAERAALATGNWAALASAWSRSADAARLGTLLGPSGKGEDAPAGDAPLAAALYVAAAEVWAHDVARDDADPAALAQADSEARACLGHALEAVRGYAPAIEALVELHERADRIDEAAAVLELQAESPASPELDARVSVLQRLARLYRDHGQYEQALGAEQRLRRLLPEDVRLMWQIDVTLAQLGRPDERIANLTAIAGRDPDPSRRGIALATAARLAEDAGERDRAIDLYRQVLASWPSERYARAALVELLRQQERWEDLVAVRRAEASELSDGPGVVRALREAAWVLEERLGRPADAAAIYRELLDRAPDEPQAALGLVRCHAASGDSLGLRAALEHRLETLATADPAVDPAALAAAAVALALAHEQAGHVDDAIDYYKRALAFVDDWAGSASAASQAALALADVAAARGDTAGRAEAYQALAAACGSPKITAALQEDLGWLHALVLEDFDAAAAAFAAASAADATARGPLLGGLLVAARRTDARGLAAAASALAEVSSMPEAAAALHLRAAALASATGTSPAERVARARSVAPDDVGALVVAAEHAPLAVPPRAGEDVAAAVDQLLARAEVLALRAQLADDPVARGSWELDRAEALEAAGRLKEAGEVVASVLRALPGDLRALEALRRLAERGGDPKTYARATLALAKRLLDVEARIGLLREAAAIFLGVEDVQAAVAVLKRILADDPGAPDFDQLVTLYRNAGDVRGLHLAIDERLAYFDRSGGDAARTVPLLLERARLRQALGNSRGALADLEELLRRDGGQTVALRMAAELYTAIGDGPRAVERWRTYLELERDDAQRGTAERAVAKVLAEDMGDTAGAILQLERILASNPDDVALRERLIGLATRVEDWHRVARELRELARLRGNFADKAREELRLAEIQRDKLGDRPGARATLGRARQHEALNLEIIGPLVELTDDPQQRQRLLGEVADELRAAIVQAPVRAPLYERLFTVAGWQRDADTQYLASLGVEAVGTPSLEHRSALAAGRGAPPMLSRHLVDPPSRAHLRPAEATSVVADVWRAIAASVTQAQALEPAKLGFGRGDKQSLKNLGKRFDPLTSVLAMFGINDAEIYVSEQRGGMARVLTAETPIFCFGADVASGASPQARYWLGRTAMLAAEATGTLAELKDAELGWYLVAAVKVIEAQLPPALAEVAATDAAAITERTRLVQKHIARRDKKALAQLAPQLQQLVDPRMIGGWRRAALTTAHRAGLLCAGDLAPVLAALDVAGARAIADAPHASDLLSWSVSVSHLELRKKLGYARSP